MRASWPDASEASWATSASLEAREGSFEGRVLERPAPLVDFRLPLAELRKAGIEESVLFVAPPDADADAIEYDVDVDADEPSLSPIPSPVSQPARASSRASRLSTPGSHWRIAPPSLPAWTGEDTPTLPLPALAIHRRRRSFVADVDVDALGARVLGETTAARASRLLVALAAFCAVLAIKTVGAEGCSLDALTAMDAGGAPVAAPGWADTAGVPVVHVPEPLPPSIVAGGPPVWIIAPRPALPPALPEDHPEDARSSAPPPVDRLGLPAPLPLPKNEVARL